MPLLKKHIEQGHAGIIDYSVWFINTRLNKNLKNEWTETFKKSYNCIMANTSAMWHKAAHITYQLSSPSCWTRAMQKKPVCLWEILGEFSGWKIGRNWKMKDRKSNRTRQKNTIKHRKWQSNDSPEIPDRSVTSDIPRLLLRGTHFTFERVDLVCAVFCVCPNNCMAANACDFLSVHVIAFRGCRNTTRESAQKGGGGGVRPLSEAHWTWLQPAELQPCLRKRLKKKHVKCLK